MTDPPEAHLSSSDLTAYAVMRAVLRSRTDGVAAAWSEVERIVGDLEERLGRDAVLTVIGALASKALSPIEQRAREAGTTTAAELDALEQHMLELLDEKQRRGPSGCSP